ncbi:membrane protein [Devosia pacifica]|uniref:Membrane protein n=1 Tax=Devosia pacifica TaxID=1335967 RepID=A0A918VNV4_9HYPH|nr:trimeric intracellular cation channel family protein [Devosia pacifica]GHA12238.1 membrane protein [Devosia pacifica]
MNAIILLDYLGVALFAATGALAASRKQLDIIGFMFLAAITGLGGGTVRDLILGVPVFWVEQQFYVLACAIAAVIVFFTAHLIESRYRLLLWFDAVALSAYGVFGAYKGLAVTNSETVAVVMGMLTGIFGGVLRDIIANEPSVLMRHEVYVAAAMAAGVVYVACNAMGLPRAWAAGLAFVVAFAVRSGGLHLGWTVPAYRPRPGRKY